MYFLYSILLLIGFLLMLPMFVLRREKYASGFSQRLGNHVEFKHDDRSVIWLHCVSVGETNAARPLVDKLLDIFPAHRLVISTTTKTGQDLARKLFTGKAHVIYFPFDWKFSVRRALSNFRPSLVLLMETEIWPRFIHDAKLTGAKIAIVNGRLSERSLGRYLHLKSFVSRVLADIDLALMQNEADAKRIIEVGIDPSKVAVTGNLKFEQTPTESDIKLSEELRRRFAISSDKPLIIAASTHEPEERYVIDALDGELGHSCRLMLVPRHPERFDDVAKLLSSTSYSHVRRSSLPSAADAGADIILLDTIGELRAAYPLAEIVFVGGSLIPHGGQSILEPAAEGKAIITGPHTANFDSVIKDFLENEAVVQTSKAPDDSKISERLYEEFMLLLEDTNRRRRLGNNAAALIRRSGQEASRRTIDHIRSLITSE
ncbi:MAG TPA: 3-deoxy-D-manno-octulosonic acid transferase [Pyrinomonadaceae bacterium]